MVRKLDLLEFATVRCRGLWDQDNELTNAERSESIPVHADRPRWLDEPTTTRDRRLSERSGVTEPADLL